MKKRMLPILLLILPYLYILIAVLCVNYGRSPSAGVLRSLLLIVVAVYISNMIYAFVIAKHGENSSVLLFWDMLLKLCNIPIYIMVFSFGFLMALLPKGIVVTPFLVIFDYLLLLPSSVYGVIGLYQARRERKITMVTDVVNVILHFIFCMDVISAIVMFCVVKAKNKKRI